MGPGEHGACRPKSAALLADDEARRELRVARANHYTRETWLAAPEEHRELLLAEDALVCPSCGNLRSVCSDPLIDWHPRTSVCWASGTREWGRRVLEKRYEKSKFPTDALTPLDGRAVYVTELAPAPEDDEFADTPSGEDGAIVLRMD